ncbi:MAG: bifunctional methionine sulfoxide reductase B/A protein [Crocinitomicaceae bacterium]
MKSKSSKQTFPLLLLLLLGYSFTACSQEKNTPTPSDSAKTEANQTLIDEMMSNQNSTWNTLTKDEAYVIEHKGTEYPNTGKYVNHKEEGTYICKRCNFPLFNSDSKFKSGTGWPSFDDMIENNVTEITDADGYRTEIVCGNCQGHLGHVFKGESFTEKSTRHCVNSISLNFISASEISEATIKMEMDTAIFASGCFWGTEYFFEKAQGVISTQVGYIGGHKDNPTYKEVCTKSTGHAEAVRVVFDPKLTDFETLAKLFFETHDPSQLNKQGPDVGTQYRTGIFYLNNDQRVTSEKLKKELEDKGLKVVTEITKASTFWDGEDYHENYYSKSGGTPYCHGYTKRF